jgi:hypothetical protein
MLLREVHPSSTRVGKPYPYTLLVAGEGHPFVALRAGLARAAAGMTSNEEGK